MLCIDGEEVDDDAYQLLLEHKSVAVQFISFLTFKENTMKNGGTLHSIAYPKTKHDD